MAEKNINIGSSFTKFTFTDENGDVVAYFRMNPTDIRLAERANEAVKYFQDKAETIKESPNVSDLIQYDKELTEKLNYILGYDAASTLFSFMSATTIMSDGKVFAALVLETIANNLEADIRNRFEKFAAVEKYTAKYQ
jgi:hypothetical protein